jgi:glycosyltransferase involved in cell wall biosynthesis
MLREMSNQKKKKRVLILGPIFDTPSGPSGQGGKLFLKLREEGYEVYKKSRYRNRLLRFLDTLYFVTLCSHKYEVILIQMFGLRAFIIEDIVSFIAQLLGKRHIVIIRGGAFIEFFESHPSWVRRVLGRSDAILTPSKYIQKNLNLNGFNVNYLPNFIEIEKFPYLYIPAKGGARLLWVRAFNDIYNPELAIYTVNNLKNTFPNIKLTMIGPDQGTLNHCLVLINELALQEHIDIVGYVSNDNLTKYYCSHDVYLNTTNYESFGVALIEAACSGIPIVSTNAGEIPFIWKHEETMLIVPTKDLNDFTTEVSKILIDENLKLFLSKNARHVAEQFTFENIKSKLKNYL